MATRTLVAGRGVVASLAALTLLSALGVARFTPHEAIAARSAREMIAAGSALVPTIGGRPWLEKPPLPQWMAIASAWSLGGGMTESAARLPMALAAVALCVLVAGMTARRFGPRVGLLAGCVQATMPWLVLRGRLAESDVPLAALVVAAMAAFDAARLGSRRAGAIFPLVAGATALLKGVGFGAALILATVFAVVLWDRDRRTVRLLARPAPIAAGVLVALAWPLLVLARHPEALPLWTRHVADRYALRSAHFAGEGWLDYLGTPLVQALPWTPLALVGAWRSLRRAVAERGGPDRLLWAWAAVPTLMVSSASARNGHYLIHALPPLSVWAALSLDRLGDRLRARGWTGPRLRRAGFALFGGLGLSWAVALAAIGPGLNPRSDEMAFYERCGRIVPEGLPLVLLYDLERPDGRDKAPYPTPFGPVPADLAARLFYLDRPATWRAGLAALGRDRPAGPFFAIGRERDREALGGASTLARGPSARWDRTFVLFRVPPLPRGAQIACPAPPGRFQ